MNVQRSEAQLDAAIRKANTDVKQSYLQVETDEAKLNARKAAMQSSDIVSQASRAQYQEGLKPWWMYYWRSAMPSLPRPII